MQHDLELLPKVDSALLISDYYLRARAFSIDNRLGQISFYLCVLIRLAYNASPARVVVDDLRWTFCYCII